MSDLTFPFQGITILGLGPGAPDLLTCKAWDWLQNIPEIYLRTRLHPTISGFPKALQVHSFDELYEKADHFEAVYEEIVRSIVNLGQRPQGVTYAVPGHPFVAEATCPEIVRKAKELGLPVRIIEGLSFLEPVFSALEIDPYPGMALVDALELAGSNHPLFPPSLPALIAQIYSRQIASDVKLTLNAVYPDTHSVRMVHAAGTPQELIEDMQLYEIDRSPNTGLMTALYIPPLGEDTSFEAFQDVITHLRAVDGCPWDREQTHLSLRQHLLEETYETLAALDAEEPAGLCEELGDLLLQIVLHAQIASEEGAFSMEDILRGINRKIIHRHPHVFGDLKVNSVSGVLENWEKLKANERADNGKKEKGLLDGVSRTLPSLSQAQEFQERVKRVGFDWPEIEGALAKITEELDEVKSAVSPEARADELGDLLFAVVNASRWYGVDAESALRKTNRRFHQRFAYIERRAREVGKQLNDMSLEEMDLFWDEAKKQGH
jgi:tetrapyrrole methylase family protein/MazG family protein